MGISLNQENFCRSLQSGISPADAYRRSYDTLGVEPAKVKKLAAALFKRPAIQLRIAELRDMGARMAVLDSADVVKEWMHLATADPGELIRHERTACRYCHGRDNGYQWRDEDEFCDELAKVLDHNAKWHDKAKHKPVPSNAGGYGYAFNALPSATCPRCFGEGHGRIFVPDTRFLSPSAKRLYAGVKQTKEGIEIKMRDQDAALLNLAKYFKLLLPDTVPTNSAGTTVTILPTIALPVDAMAAAKMYQDIMQGKT